MIGTAIGYRRVSSTEQVHGFSLHEQERTIREWCVRAGLPLLAIYDNGTRGESGKDLARDGFQQVLDHIDRGGITHVVVAKLDRLGRSFRDIAKLLEDWEAQDVRLISVGEGITDSHGTNRTLIHLLSEFAEMERTRLIARVKPGMRARFDAGLPPTKVPFGYRIETTPGIGTRPVRRLVPDPVTAEIVRRAFHLAASKEWGSRRLASALTQAYPDTSFSPGRVAHLLHDVVYLGVLTATVDGKPAFRYGNHEAIIDQALFSHVQEVLGNRRDLAAAGVSASASSLLGGIARCATCSEVVVFRSTFPGAEEPVYVCASRSRQGGHCGAGSVRVARADAFVWAQVLAGVEAMRVRLASQFRDAIQDVPRYLDAQRERAHACLAQLERQEADLAAQCEHGQVTEDDLVARCGVIDAERQRQQALLAETDGWSYIQLLHHVVPGERRALLVPDAVAAATLSLIDRRRLLGEVCEVRIALRTDPFLDVAVSSDPGTYAPLLKGFSMAVARDLVIDQEEAMRRMGYTKTTTRPDGCDVWDHPTRERQVVRWADGRLIKVDELQ